MTLRERRTKALLGGVGRGERERGGLGGGPVLLAHRVPDLLAVDRQAAGGLDAHAHGVADDLHHGDDDVVAHHDLLAGAAGDEQHASSLDQLRTGMEGGDYAAAATAG